MTDFLKYLSPAEVKSHKEFASYCQQELGIPYPTRADMIKLGKNINGLFRNYPQADYFTLCRIVDWAKARNQRYAHSHSLVMAFRYAWKDGFLPELDPKRQTVDEKLENSITKALEKETHPFWRERLVGAEGVQARTKVFEAWKAQSQHA